MGMKLPLWTHALTPAKWAMVAVLVIALIIFALTWDPFGFRRRANERADHAEQSETLTKGTSAALEKTQAKETAIQGEAHEAVDDVMSQPGADQPLPDGLRDSFKRGVDGVRDPSGKDRGSRDAAKALPSR